MAVPAGAGTSGASTVEGSGPAPNIPSLGTLFLGFCTVALSGFGGVLPFARRMIVEDRKWMTGPEFTDVLSLCQFLPGPNLVNVSITIGARFHGFIGALAALFGLVLPPLCVVLTLAMLYDAFGGMEMVQRAFVGIAAAAAGLVIATGIKMAAPLWRQPIALAFLIAVFALVALARFSLPTVVFGLAPFSIAAAWWTRRR
jgi:chromate transporter